MQKKQRSLSVLIATLALFAAFNLAAQTPPRQTLRGHIPVAVARFHLAPISRVAATRQLNLTIGLPLRNQAELDRLLQELYDPASPNFRQYLTPEQFTEQFGPTEQDYQKIMAFARANGLAVTATHGNRLLLNVSGPVANVEKAFNVTLRVYRHPTEDRTFFAPEAEPTVDVDLPIRDVSGLESYSRPYPRSIVEFKGQSGVPRLGSGPSGQYFGNDFRAAYAPGVTLTGSGQMVGLVAFDGYYLKDITNYLGQAGWTNVPLQNVLIGGFSGIPTTDSDAVAEVSLDIEMAIAMAPGLAKVVVFEGNPTNAYFNPNDVLNTMAASNMIKQLSCSWGWSGGPSGTTDSIFQQMAAQGQTFLSASGDSDAYTTGSGSVNGVDNPSLPNTPASSPYITQVGGTTLSTTGAGGTWTAETVWNWGYVSSANAYLGSSGGISSYYSIPIWQQGINMTTNHGSTTTRNTPDVALTADNIYIYYNNGGTLTVGGTSCAAPMWAGFIALVNQQAAAKGKPVVGFINPAIYAIGKGANYSACFHDVTTGDNTWPSSPTNFYATSGYDLCTGWGTPNGLNLINALAAPDDFGITPGTGFIAFGGVGGPFSANAQTYSLTNSGETAFDWLLLGKPTWLDVSSTGGTLAAGGFTTVAVNLNSAGYGLPAGIYATNLTFTNLSSGIAQLRQFTLQVGQSLVQNGGFETGDFIYWTMTNDDYSLVDSSTNSTSGIPPHSGTYLAALGRYGALGYLSQTLSTVSNQAYLISLWFNSPSYSGGNTPNQFMVSWNGTTLFNRTNIGVISTWTNMTFIITATNSSSVLQFGERVDPWYLGLDDVAVWPIPNPSFRSVYRTNGNNLVFSWNSLASLVYQVQYSTNLANTHWVILSTNTATGPVTTYTNAYGSGPQRFYRIRRLP